MHRRRDVPMVQRGKSDGKTNMDLKWINFLKATVVVNGYKSSCAKTDESFSK